MLTSLNSFKNSASCKNGTSDPLGMLSKKSLGCDLKALPKRKRLRANIQDLFLSNQVSGVRTGSLVENAQDANACGFADIPHIGGPRDERCRIEIGTPNQLHKINRGCAMHSKANKPR